jgi:hypothetical protein
VVFEPDTRSDTDVSPARSGLGRRILLSVGVVVVALAGVVGFFVGSSDATSASTVAVFGGLMAVPLTPLSMALFAAVVATVVLSTLFGLVALASRYDDADERGA